MGFSFQYKMGWDFLSTLLFFSQKDVCQEIFTNRLSGHVSFRAIGENLSVSSSKNRELGIKKNTHSLISREDFFGVYTFVKN